MGIISSIDLNDSEILRLHRGPITWARLREGSHMDIDGFVEALVEQVNLCGFTCTPKVFETNQPGAYKFEIEITGRTLGSLFDPDRQVHEVVNNILELPGQGTGFIPSKDGVAQLLNRETGKHKKH